MSFDIFLDRFDAVGPGAATKAGVLEVLHSRQYTGPDPFGFYRVAFPDGATVEFSAKGLESDGPFSGCAFHVRAFGQELVDFIFAIAYAGGMAIMPAMKGGLIIAVHEDINRRIPSAVLENLKLVEVSSPSELKALLVGGFDGWSAFRNQAVRPV